VTISIGISCRDASVNYLPQALAASSIPLGVDVVAQVLRPDESRQKTSGWFLVGIRNQPPVDGSLSEAFPADGETASEKRPLRAAAWMLARLEPQ